MKTGISPAARWIPGVLLVILIVTLLILILFFRAPTPPLAESTPIPSQTIVPSPTPPGLDLGQDTNQSVRLAWFYKPPDDLLLPTVAKNFHIFILTHKDEAHRDTLKALGIRSPILLYLQLVEIKDPGSCTESPQGNQVAYQPNDFCQISEQHPDWFLLDQNGNRIVTNESVYMDPGNAEYRAFWLQRARALQEKYQWDGFFIDNLEASLGKLSAKGVVIPKYPDDASYQAATEGFLRYLRDSYFEPRQLPVLANIISVRDRQVWLRYLQYLDGAMVESFAVDWSQDYLSDSNWEDQIAAIEAALSQGKNLILVAQAAPSDPDRQQFALASYLLVANENAFFRYEDAESYREVSLYENYFLDLGEPLGPRYRDGSSWRRDFANGYVLVDPGAHRAEITLTP
jgi:hypothetical protein